MLAVQEANVGHTVAVTIGLAVDIAAAGFCIVFPKNATILPPWKKRGVLEFPGTRDLFIPQ